MDKQIKEMAKDMYSPGIEYNTYYKHDCEILARKLAEKGYCKASEIAREMFAEIEKMCIDTFGNFNHRIFAELKKKYMEVEK